MVYRFILREYLSTKEELNMYIIKSYLSAFAIFLIIDLIWLGFIAKDLYAKYLGFIMAKNINWTAAIIFYMIFVGGILFLL